MTEIPVDVGPELVAGYFDCWNSTDAAARRRAVETAWAFDARFVDSVADASAHEALAKSTGVGAALDVTSLIQQTLNSKIAELMETRP